MNKNVKNKITIVDFYLDIGKRKKPYFDDYLKYVKNIKKNLEQLLGKTDVYVFGSVVRGDYSPYQSDIDILAVSKNVPRRLSEKTSLKLRAREGIDPLAPFQIHLVTPDEYQNWYRYFIKAKIKVE